MDFQELPENITIGGKYKPAMEIKSIEDAKKYFDILVKHCMRHGRSKEDAVIIEKSNLGYFAGYYDGKTRKRVEGLFQCLHPIFGSIADKGETTPKEAFEMGKAWCLPNTETVRQKE